MRFERLEIGIIRADIVRKHVSPYVHVNSSRLIPSSRIVLDSHYAWDIVSSIEYTAVSAKVVQLKSIKAYATISKGMMGCGCSLLHRQFHEFSAPWKAVL